MTLIPPYRYAEGLRLIDLDTKKKGKTMFYELLAHVIVEDTLREADKNRLIKIANRSRKTQNRHRLAKLTRRFKLIRNGKCEDNSISQQKYDVDYMKEMTHENSNL